MNFLSNFSTLWLLTSFFAYIYLGACWHVYMTEQPYSKRFHAAKAKSQVWITFCHVAAWWLFLIAFAIMLFIDWLGDPKAPTLKDLLLDMMPYESWIRLGRWATLLGGIVALATFGPDIRRKLRGDIEVEQPLTAPKPTSNDTIRERPWEPTSRIRMYDIE